MTPHSAFLLLTSALYLSAGEVYPSGFLPLSAGNVLWEPLANIYQGSPLFRALRDSSQLKGKRSACDFKDPCGGCRARAYASTGDPLAEEPYCGYMVLGTFKSS